MSIRSNLILKGNDKLLEKQKIGIISSRNILPHLTHTIVQAFDHISKSDIIFISGWHAPIEKEIHQFLTDADKPHIHIGAKSISELSCKLGKEKTFFMTHCRSNITRITRENALKRNRILCEISDILIIPWLDPNGRTHSIVSEFMNEKTVYVFDKEFNINLIERGAQPFKMEYLISNIEGHYANN